MYTDITYNLDGKKPRDIKAHNTNLVLSLFHSLNETTLTEMSEKTSLSKTTISKIFSRLAKNGIILPTRQGSSTAEGGKRPIMFSLNPDYCYSILISAGFADHITCTVVNLTGDTLYSRRIDTNPQILYPDAICLIAQLVQKAMEELRILSQKLCGIAILYDGIVDTINRVAIHSAHHEWESNLPICNDLQSILNLDTNFVMDNASSFSGYAETVLRYSTLGNKMVITWDKDSTLGYCMVSNQNLIGNSEGITGGFAHVVLEPSSTIVCQCGSRGCLQSLLSKDALFERVSHICSKYPSSPITKKFKDKTLTSSDIFMLSSKNDPVAIDLMQYISRYFSILIHNTFCLYSVQEVILQGMFALSGNLFLDMLRGELLNFNKLSIYKNIKVSYSQYCSGQPLDRINPYHKGANIYLSKLFINSSYHTST